MPTLKVLRIALSNRSHTGVMRTERRNSDVPLRIYEPVIQIVGVV